MDKAIVIIGNILKNKYFWFLVGAIVIYIMIKKNWYKFQKLGAPRYVDYQRDDSGKIIGLTSERKFQLETMARDAQVTLSGYFTDKISILNQLNALSDQELLYLSQFYKKALTRGESTLYEDVDDAMLPFSEMDEKVQVRLKKIGEY